MGQILHFSCSTCPYSEEVHVGSGMAGIGLDAMICSDCLRVTSVVTEDVNLDSRDSGNDDITLSRCDLCGGGNIAPISFSDEPQQGALSRLEDQCPACNTGYLRAEVIGLWD